MFGQDFTGIGYTNSDAGILLRECNAGVRFFYRSYKSSLLLTHLF